MAALSYENDSRYSGPGLPAAEKPSASEGRSAKQLIPLGVKHVLKEGRRKSGRRVKLPIVRSKRPATLELDNVKIYEIISFP